MPLISRCTFSVCASKKQRNWPPYNAFNCKVHSYLRDFKLEKSCFLEYMKYGLFIYSCKNMCTAKRIKYLGINLPKETNMSTNLENSTVATALEKGSFHSNPKGRQCQRMLKLPHNCTHLTRQESNAKILQARLQQYMNLELPDVQAGFRKGRGTREQTANIHWIIKKAREFQKNIYFCFIDYV